MEPSKMLENAKYVHDKKHHFDSQNGAEDTFAKEPLLEKNEVQLVEPSSTNLASVGPNESLT